MVRSGLDAYKIVLYRQDDGSWVAEVPAISGCYALMATREEALAELRRVFDMIAEEYQERGVPLPEDTTEVVSAWRHCAGVSRGGEPARLRQASTDRQSRATDPSRWPGRDDTPWPLITRASAAPSFRVRFGMNFAMPRAAHFGYDLRDAHVP